GQLPVPDHPARRLPVGEPPQRLAPAPHPLLDPGPVAPHPPGHPDVLRRRPAAGPGPDLQQRPRTRPRPAPRPLRPRRDRGELGARVEIRHRLAGTQQQRGGDGGRMSPRLGQTPSQTVGPYVSMAFPREGDNVLPVPDGGGERIVITGVVFDGDRNHIEDAVIETWQANPLGRYNHPDDNREEIPLDPKFTG